MIAGAILLALGFVGLGFVGMGLRQRSVEAGIDTASDQDPSKPKPELVQTPVANRKAKLEEQKRDRWAAN
jgi:3-hydroxyisobutyrate dehydrogenase-like beta-hydroxyacid dehydrogenase